MYGDGEKLRSEFSGRIISAQDSVGERGDGSPAGTGAASAMVHGLLYCAAAEHGWIPEDLAGRLAAEWTQHQVSKDARQKSRVDTR